jgi:hypothetical protein
MAKGASQRGLGSTTFAPDNKLAVKWADKGAPGSSGAGPKSAANGSLRSTPDKIYAGKFTGRTSK